MSAQLTARLRLPLAITRLEVQVKYKQRGWAAMSSVSEDSEGRRGSTITSPLATTLLLPELLDIVFEWVCAEDYHKRTIFACSLVSSHWEALSRRQRFRAVSLSIDDDPAETMDFLRWDAFAASPRFPQMAHWIRKLTLSFTKTLNGSVHSGFLKILSLIPQLHELDLHGSFSQRIVADPDRVPVDAAHGITRLSLTRHSNRERQSEPLALCDLLSLFPSLLELELTGVTIRYPKPGHPTHDWTQWIVPTPKVLALRGSRVATVLHGMQLSSLVRSLILDDYEWQSHAELVRKLAPKLEAFDVSARIAPDLAEFSALRSLTLRGQILWPQWEHVASALGTLRRTSPLRSFTFVVHIAHDTAATPAGLRAEISPGLLPTQDIEDVLVRLATQGELRNIVFEVQRGHVEFISFPNLFSAYFPRLVELGLLVTYPYDKMTSRFVLP